MAENKERSVTASDVAKKAGVSKWTVSRAFTDGASISPASLEAVLEAAAELGYRPNLLARSLTTKRTNIIGLVVDELGNPNMLELLDAFSRKLQQMGYMTMLLNITSDQSHRTTLSLADQFQVDGLIFLGTLLTHELLQVARDIRNIPLIVVQRNSDNPSIQVVTTDGYHAGMEIADLFTAQGYRRIGYLAGPQSESTQLLRLEGFRDRLAEQGLAVWPVLSADHYQHGEGVQAMDRYLDSTPPEARIEALFCENDILAFGVLDALRRRSGAARMAVVGFDDIAFAASPCYDLTTYRQPAELLVDEAIRRLDAQDKTESHFLARGTLVLRSSHLLAADPARSPKC